MSSLTASLRKHVEQLAASPRKPGTPEHADARDYVRQHLSQAGFDVSEAVYKGLNCDMINLVTSPTPSDDSLPLVVVGAHYDTTPDSPGADDNASGVAGLMELAKWIATRLGEGSATARLQMVAYDFEEYGILGSQCHCDDLHQANTSLRGMISLEMLGYVDKTPGSQNLPPILAGRYSDVGNFIGVVGNETSQSLVETVVGGMQSVQGLPVEHVVVPGDGTMIPETRFSDHSSFWDRGYPALMITDTAFFRNPHYHKTSDTPDTLDYDFMAKVTEGVCEAVWRLVTLT